MANYILFCPKFSGQNVHNYAWYNGVALTEELLSNLNELSSNSFVVLPEESLETLVPLLRETLFY